MDELVHLRQEMEGTEPEAPECEHAWGDWDAVYHGGYLQWRDCQRCRASESRACWPFGPKEPPEPKAPPRPPFTLTYVLASGERREVTLSGDATVRVAFDGTLIITHESDVRALTEIRPAEGA